MSSLQEQLLKAGLVDEKKVTRANQEKHKRANQARKKQGKNARNAAAPKPPLHDKKAQRDRELNQKRKDEAKRKELAAQAKQLIETNRQDRAGGEHPYSFVYRGKVKKIYVTEAQRKQLVDGKLAIATYVARDGRRFELVPKAVADKVAERDAPAVIEPGGPAKTGQAEDDAYAAYKVPDDLIW